MSDPIKASGTNSLGTPWEVYNDISIGDHYLCVFNGGNPVFTGSKKDCLMMAENWS